MASIIIKDGDKEYTLQFNRYSIVQMEEKGFDVKNIEKKPLSTITKLIRGAFYMHHPRMTDAEIDAVADKLGDTEKLVEELVKLYGDALMALTQGNQDKSKNVMWEKH